MPLLGTEGWKARFPRTLDERIATFGPVESFGWFVIGALLLIAGVLGVVTFVIALREARERRGLEALAEEKGECSMRKTLIAVLVGTALLLALSVSAGWAGQIAGKIQKVDHSERHFVLEDSTQVWVAEGFPIETLKEGATVEGSYDERDGKKIATTLKVSE